MESMWSHTGDVWRDPGGNAMLAERGPAWRSKTSLLDARDARCAMRDARCEMLVLPEVQDRLCMWSGLVAFIFAPAFFPPIADKYGQRKSIKYFALSVAAYLDGLSSSSWNAHAVLTLGLLRQDHPGGIGAWHAYRVST
ncbi:hypothetical protein E4U21_007428 [Claviceps maximensis]|nr:hypothetical protein E4U21_007428 [Claviceps maximensis]